MNSNNSDWAKRKIKDYEAIAIDFNHKAGEEMVIEHGDFESYRDAYRFYMSVFVLFLFVSFSFIFASSVIIANVDSVKIYTSSTHGDVELITNKYER